MYIIIKKLTIMTNFKTITFTDYYEQLSASDGKNSKEGYTCLTSSAKSNK